MDDIDARFQTAPVFSIRHIVCPYLINNRFILSHRRIYWFLILITLRSRLIHFTLTVDIIFSLFISFGFFLLSLFDSIWYRDRLMCQLIDILHLNRTQKKLLTSMARCFILVFGQGFFEKERQWEKKPRWKTITLL